MASTTEVQQRMLLLHAKMRKAKEKVNPSSSRRSKHLDISEEEEEEGRRCRGDDEEEIVKLLVADQGHSVFSFMLMPWTRLQSFLYISFFLLHTYLLRGLSLLVLLPRRLLHTILPDELLLKYPRLDTHVPLKNIQKHCILGKGEFAVVYLATDSTTQKTYALKTMSKLHLLEHRTDAISSTMREKEIMSSIYHPFISMIHACYQDDRYIYFLLPLFQGGDLFGLIYKEDGSRHGLKEDDAIFYSACIVEAFAHLHSRSIVYRDLKPDNVMINSQGYAVLIDMGLAKFVVGKTYSMVGTPSYMASETILGIGHNQAVDYWALGVLIYEMLEGDTPFYFEGATQKQEFEGIIRCDYKCPDSFSENAKDLISSLLVSDPQKRIGFRGRRGHLDVMNHPWFASINFRCLRRMEIQAPRVPELNDLMDESNFPEHDPDEEPYRELTKQEQSLFKGF